MENLEQGLEIGHGTKLEIGHGIEIGKVNDGVRIGGTWIASNGVAGLN